MKPKGSSAWPRASRRDAEKKIVERLKAEGREDLL